MEMEIPEHVLAQIRKKYSTITNAYKSQCPCQLQNVASLELVEKLQYSSQRPRDERGTTSKLVHLPYSSLFKGDHGTRSSSKRIFIVGEAGIGKTLLCASIAEDWANGKFFQEFFMVLLLPLHQRGVASAQNLPELFKNLYEFESKTCSTVEMYLMANRADNILILADGWDEVCKSQRQEESFLHRLLFGDLLPSSSLTVVATSRLASIPQQFISRFITVQGFSEETTKSYIQLEFSSSPEKLSYITGQLDTNPLVGSMCNVPLNLAMISNLCRSCDDPLPSTMPELYDKLAWSLAQLKINSAKKFGTIRKLSDRRDLPDKLQQSWSLLCQLAFKTVENSHATFSQMEASRFLTTELETFGLLKPACSGVDEVMFSFFQPAFRYYLAVLHLMEQPLSVQLAVIERIGPVSPFFWRCLLYMSRDKNDDVISKAAQTFLKLHYSCNDVYLLSFESKNEIVDREVVKSLCASESPIMLHSRNAYECVAMVHVLEKIDEQCTVEINFQNCKLKATQISKLANALDKRDRSNVIQVKGLDLSNNSLNDSIAVDFFNKALPSLRSLEKLFLRSCEIGAEGLSAIVNALAKSSCQSLTQLDLSFNSLSVGCLECFQCHINGGNLQKMEILILKGSLAKDVNMSFLKSFAAILSTKCRCLRRLDLSANKLGACDDPDLSAIVSQLTASLGNSFDLRLDDDYMSEVDNTFLAIMEESIRNKGTIDHTIAHGVIVGPGRSGKNTLMQRLMGQGPPDPNTISPSTGVLENVVKVEVKKLCTVAAAVSNLNWQRLEYDEEALEIMMTTAKNYSHEGSIPRPIIIKYIVKENKSESRQEMKSLLPSDKDKKSKLTAIGAMKKPSGSESTDGASIEATTEHVFVYSSDMAPVEILKKAVKLRRMDALRVHLESSWSLYLTNTGGQIEFQEHLPLLVCGPSIFFVTFPLHHDLDKPYEVRYQYPDGSVKKYSSTPTLIQELLQTLATIYALDYATVQIGDEEVNLKPKVFFIGTHKDCLVGPEPDREKKIKQIDKKLQTYVRQTSLFHQGSIQFAQSLKQMIFTVNNLSKDDGDFQKIRSAVQLTVEKKCYTEFTVQCPSSWLIFSLILRAKHIMSNQVLRLEDCFKIAQECGISSHEELTTALSFIHSRLGLVRYFNVKELDSLVVIDPQVLFDKITDLIVETFISENAEENEIEEFRQKGIISVAVMKRISEKSNKDVQLPLTWLTSLLNHLRLAALFKDHYERKYYFFPSAICHIPTAQDATVELTPHTTPPPFLIAFETGFCPRGIAGALMKCLMTNEMKSNRSWELLPDKIFRNQVSFYVEARGDITIKVLPTHLEITVDSDVDLAETGCNESQTCEEVYMQIAKSMKIVTSLYKKCEYFWTFYCTLVKCKTNPHPAVIEWNHNVPFKLRCKVFNKSGGLPKGYELWNIQRKGIYVHSSLSVRRSSITYQENIYIICV